jgi:hypothetical protein
MGKKERISDGEIEQRTKSGENRTESRDVDERGQQQRRDNKR